MVRQEEEAWGDSRPIMGTGRALQGPLPQARNLRRELSDTDKDYGPKLEKRPSG